MGHTCAHAHESFNGGIWECACGDGAMLKVLGSKGNDVFSSDLYDREYGEAGLNFLASERPADNIFTNPPYNSAQQFVEKGVELANNKLALLLRLAFLEGGHRAKTIFTDCPPSRVWVFSERITFYPRGVKVKGSGATAYAWFVWGNSHKGETNLNWIKPGFKKAYS